MTITKYSVPAEVEKKILAAIELKKELAKYEEEIKSQLTQAMIDNNIYSIKNDNYSVTLVTRNNYKCDDIDNIDPVFTKVGLDSTKISSHSKLYGELPDGIKQVETKYITWRVK